MSDRPSDALQPKSKRRPGAQLTKDDVDSEDDDNGVRDSAGALWMNGSTATDGVARDLLPAPATHN
jgi:hypothetical protein